MLATVPTMIPATMSPGPSSVARAESTHPEEHGRTLRRARGISIGPPMPPYPRWRYFPAFAAPPDWVGPVIGTFAAVQAQIDSAVENRMESDDVLRVLGDGLTDLGFAVEQGKKKAGKLPRPVFFGDEGTYLRTYEIDAFEATRGIALEVEAGRATMGNAIYRDVIQASLMVDARFLVLAVPVEYRYMSKGKLMKEPSYSKTYSVVDAIYGSPRLSLPFEGLLPVGY